MIRFVLDDYIPGSPTEARPVSACPDPDSHNEFSAVQAGDQPVNNLFTAWISQFQNSTFA